MFIFGEIGLAGVVLLGLWIYAIFDVISTPEGAARNLPKIMWLAIVVFLPDIGSIAWLLLGRPSTKSFHLEGTRSYGKSGANRRERVNQELSRSDELNARLEQWERENAARKHDAERAAALAAQPFCAQQTQLFFALGRLCLVRCVGAPSPTRWVGHYRHTACKAAHVAAHVVAVNPGHCLVPAVWRHTQRCDGP